MADSPTPLAQAYAATAPGRCAVYGKLEPAAHRLARRFRAFRECGLAATDAIRRARGETQIGFARGIDRNRGAIDYAGRAWVERPADIGLRFVGFADDLAGRAVPHCGWHCRDPHFAGEVYRGAVYQFPGRKGRALYVAGYREGENLRRGWADMSGDAGARLHLSGFYPGEVGGERPAYDSGATDAALAADSIAESEAAKERDYQEAWQTACRWQELESEAQEELNAARQLIRDIRAASRSAAGAIPASICAALRDRVKAHLEAWRAAIEGRKTIEAAFVHRWRSPDGARHCDTLAAFAASNL